MVILRMETPILPLRRTFSDSALELEALQSRKPLIQRIEAAHSLGTLCKPVQRGVGYVQNRMRRDLEKESTEPLRVRFSSPVVQRIYTYQQLGNGT